MKRYVFSFLIPYLVFVLVGCKLSDDQVEGYIGNLNPTHDPISIAIEKVYPDNGSNWNDWVQRDYTKTPFDSDDVACVPSDVLPDWCIHGAEKLKATLPTGDYSCTDFEYYDNADAFSWRCRQSGGQLEIYSVRLKAKRGLKNLIEGTSWKPMQLNVKERTSGQIVFQSPAQAWWSNPIEPLPDNNGTGSTNLTGAGKVYVATTSMTTDGYYLGDPKMSIVTLNGSVLRFSGSASTVCDDLGVFDQSTGISTVICVGWSSSTSWVEADVRADPVAGVVATNGLKVGSSKHLAITNLVASGASGDGIEATYSNHTKFISVVTHSNGGHGIDRRYAGTGSGFLHDIVAFNNAGYGVASHDISDGFTIMNKIHTYNNGRGLVVSFHNLAIVSQILSANNDTVGLAYYDNSWIESYFHGITGVNNGTHGFHYIAGRDSAVTGLLTANNGQDGFFIDRAAVTSTYGNIASFRNGSYGIHSDQTNESNYIGNLLIGQNTTADCLESAGTNPGIDNSCTTNANDVALVTANPFVGWVDSDSANANGSTGTELFSNITDFLSFENPFRLWAPDDSSPLTSLTRGNCNGGSCSILDLSLSASDTEIFMRMDTGTTASSAFVANATCPAAVHGNKAFTSPQPSLWWEVMGDGVGDEDGWCDGGEDCITFIYLLNAFEIMLDEIGNDNGLCESNEACVYAPNFGAYQGHGDYEQNGTCIFQDGVVQGVTMYGYPSLGY